MYGEPADRPGRGPRHHRHARGTHGQLRAVRGGVHAGHELHRGPDRGGSGGRAGPARGRAVHGRPRGRRAHRGGRGVARRGGPLPARGGAGVPVGEPDDHRASPARPGGRDLAGHPGADPRRAVLDLRPRRGREGPRARHRADPGELLHAVPRLPAGHHGAGDRGRADGRRRDQRLPADHPRPLDGVDRVPPRRRPAADPRRRAGAGRDVRGDRARVHRGEQRRVPVRLRGVPGGVRRRVRAAVDRDGLARGAPDDAPLSDGGADHRGRRAAVHHAGAVRPRVPRALQVQPEQADRDAGAVGLRARPVPDPGLRRHDRLRADQGALLRGPRGHQPDGHRARGPGASWPRSRPGTGRRRA